MKKTPPPSKAEEFFIPDAKQLANSRFVLHTDGKAHFFLYTPWKNTPQLQFVP